MSSVLMNIPDLPKKSPASWLAKHYKEQTLSYQQIMVIFFNEFSKRVSRINRNCSVVIQRKAIVNIFQNMEKTWQTFSDLSGFGVWSLFRNKVEEAAPEIIKWEKELGAIGITKTTT